MNRASDSAQRQVMLTELGHALRHVSGGYMMPTLIAAVDRATPREPDLLDWRVWSVGWADGFSCGEEEVFRKYGLRHISRKLRVSLMREARQRRERPRS